MSSTNSLPTTNGVTHPVGASDEDVFEQTLSTAEKREFERQWLSRLRQLQEPDDILFDWEPRAFQSLVNYFNDDCVEESFYRILKAIEVAHDDQGHTLNALMRRSIVDLDEKFGVTYDWDAHNDDDRHPWVLRTEIRDRRYDFNEEPLYNHFRWFYRCRENGWVNPVHDDGTVTLGQFDIQFRTEIHRAIDCLAEVLSLNRHRKSYDELIQAVVRS